MKKITLSFDRVRISDVFGFSIGKYGTFYSLNKLIEKLSITNQLTVYTRKPIFVKTTRIYISVKNEWLNYTCFIGENEYVFKACSSAMSHLPFKENGCILHVKTSDLKSIYK